MTNMSQYAVSDSQDLKALEHKGQNLKARISGVTTRTYPATEKGPAITKPVLSFEGKEKVLVCSRTNTKILCKAYGDEDTDWIGHEIGLATHDYDVGTGWIITPLDVEAPAFDDDIPF